MNDKKPGRAKSKTLLAVLLTALAGLALAADGDLDTSFGTSGKLEINFPNATNDELQAARQQADGSFLAVGVGQQPDQGNGPGPSNHILFLAHITPQGVGVSTDAAPFQTKDIGATIDRVNGGSSPSDGKFLLGGDGQSTGAFVGFQGKIVRFSLNNSTGALTVDASFVRPNGVNNESSCGTVFAESSAANANIVAACVVGSSTDNSVGRLGIIRLNSSLVADSTFGSGGTALITTFPSGFTAYNNSNGNQQLVRDTSGNYYLVGEASGNFDTNGNEQNTAAIVAKFNSSGTLVSGFGTNGVAVILSSLNNANAKARAISIALDASGNLLVGGQKPGTNPQCTGCDDGFIARLSSSTGALDTANFGTNGIFAIQGGNGDSTPRTLLPAASGIYFLTGDNLFRLTAAGALDSNFVSASTNAGTLNNDSASDTSAWGGLLQLDANNAFLLGGVNGSCVGVNVCGNTTQTSSNHAIIAKVRLVTDTTPNAFTFVAATNQPLNSTATSGAVVISGINSAAPISVSGAAGSAFSINGAPFTSTATTVNNGDSVVVHHTTSSSPNTTVSTTLTVGGVPGTFSSTTVPANTMPNPYSFAAKITQPVNTAVVSDPATITGINTAAPISITGGTNPGYSVGCTGTFRSDNSTINNNQTVCVRVTSANAPNTSTSTTLNVGGVTASFQVTTANGPIVSLSPTSLSFGSHPTGTNNGPMTVTLTNTGTAVLNISTIAISTGSGDYTIANTSTCANGGTVAASGGSCKIDVIFNASTTGARNGTLSITSDATSSVDHVQLTGTGTGPVPAVSLSPASLSFPGQNVGTTSSAMSTTVTNTGTASLTFTSITPTAHYAVASGANSCSTVTPVAANASCIIYVTYSPAAATASGADTGNVTIISNDPNSPAFLTLSGTGLAPTVGLAPNPRSFPDTNVGSTSAAQTITLSNSGNGTLNISSISVSPAEYSKTGGSCGATLAASSSCTITITFTPASNGSRPGTMTLVTSNASPLQYTVNLSGNGTTPATATLAPTSVNFGPQNVGSTSAAQTITLTNSGTLTLSSIAITHTGDYATLADASKPCGATLAGGASCVIDVTFTPTVTGNRAGTVVVNSSAGTSSATLSGSGTTPPTATLAPTTLTFTSQLVGSTSAPQTIKLSNTGTLPLNSIVITHAGDYATPAAASNPCGATLAGGANCNISVTFTPTAVGARNGSVTVASNAPGGNATVTLSGTGIAPALTLAPTSLSFPQTNVGSSSAVKTATVTNSGTAPLNVGAISASGDYQQTNDCSSALAAGAHCTITVTFTPTSAGTRSGSVTVPSNAASSPDHLGLTGTSISTATTTGAGGQSVTLTVDQGVIASFTSSATPSSGLPDGYTFPLGFFNFTVSGLPATGTPATVHVSFTLPAGSGANSYMKCTGSSCAAFSGASVSGNTLSFTMIDNATGDSNGAQGTITDPGAPAVAPKSSGGGSMEWMTLLLLGVPGLLRRRRFWH